MNLPKMIAPSEQRNVPMGGVLQIHVTRACDLACVGCTQGSNLAGKPVVMSVENFEKACQSLAEPLYFGTVGMFGGNPCVHPQFEKLCEVMRKYIPYRQRGLWSNNLMGKGEIVRKTFSPAVSNLNVHQMKAAWDEMKQDWPASHPKGLVEDSMHSPPFVAIGDMEDMSEEEKWSAIASCDINRWWSAMICEFRGELRAFFCELAGAQAMLHQDDPSYPDTGLPVEPGWWTKGIEDFAGQIRKHCWECGIPLKGQLPAQGNLEMVSPVHADIYKLKRRGRKVKLVTKRSELALREGPATQYLTTERKA